MWREQLETNNGTAGEKRICAFGLHASQNPDGADGILQNTSRRKTKFYAGYIQQRRTDNALDAEAKTPV